MKRPRWMFSIQKDYDNYFLKIKKENININEYLNRWDLIPDFNINKIEDNTKNYFLVKDRYIGWSNTLYDYTDWKSNKRDYDLRKVKIGDYLLYYFDSQSIYFKQQLKKFIE